MNTRILTYGSGRKAIKWFSHKVSGICPLVILDNLAQCCSVCIQGTGLFPAFHWSTVVNIQASFKHDLPQLSFEISNTHVVDIRHYPKSKCWVYPVFLSLTKLPSRSGTLGGEASKSWMSLSAINLSISSSHPGSSEKSP